MVSDEIIEERRAFQDNVDGRHSSSVDPLKPSIGYNPAANPSR